MPNATIVNASQNENPDLYFALRGGGNNFGIVTDFNARLVPQGMILSGDKTYHANYTDDIVAQVDQLSTTLSNDTFMCFSSRYAYNQTTDGFAMSMTHAYYEPVENPLVFDGLSKVPYESSTVRVDWMSNFAAESTSPHGSR